MKINKNIFTLAGIFLFFISSTSAQINFEKTKEINYDEYMSIMPIDEDMLLSLIKDCFNCGEDIADFSFNWGNSFNTAVNNEILLRKAYEKRKRDWFNKQKNLIKENIESKLGKNFNNYNEAKDALFLFSEQENIRINSITPKNKYGNLRSQGFAIQNNHLKDLKFLQLRKLEINANNINNSAYKYIKVDGIALKDIKTINALNSKWNSLYDDFGENYGTTYYYKNVYKTLQQINSESGLKDLVINLKNNYYNSFDEWEQLNLMQFLLNFEEIKKYSRPPYPYNPLLAKFKDIDIATSPVIEEYAQQNSGTRSDFFTKSCTIRIRAGRDYITKVIPECRKAQTDALNNLLNNVNTEDFDIENLLEGARTNILNNNNLTEAEKLIEFRKLYDTYDPLLTSTSSQDNYNAKIKSYIAYFQRRGNHEFANYLESLLPLDNTFSKEDYIKLYETIREQKLNYFYALLKEIGLATFDAFKPVIEMALWEVGGGVALKVLSKLPIKYLTTPIKNVIARLKAPTSTAFSNLKHAKKYGIQSYKQLAKEFEQLGLKLSKEGVERHHLIEVRFFKENPNIRAQLQNKFGTNTDDWLCIIVEKTNRLTQSEHYILSQKWLKAIGKKNQTPGTTGFNSDNVPFNVIIEQARKIYKDYPEILNALGI